MPGSSEHDPVQSEIFVLGGFTDGIEGPACDAAGNLYAVNFDRQGTIGRVTPDGRAEVFLELPAGSVGNGIRFDSSGKMLIADYVAHTVWRCDLETRALEPFAFEPRMNQPNDLAIGANDLVYCSDPNWANGTGNLWRVNPDGTTALLETGMGTTNGIEVSPDECTLYVNETVQRTIWAYDLSSAGEVSNKRTLVQFDDHALDGMRCDTAGNLYVTRYSKGVIAKISPAGDSLAEIRLGGSRPSNVAFGGPDGRTLYVTIVDHGSVESFRTEHPGREWALHQRGIGGRNDD
jgi:gluconolactonase